MLDSKLISMLLRICHLWQMEVTLIDSSVIIVYSGAGWGGGVQWVDRVPTFTRSLVYSIWATQPPSILP